MEKYKKIFHIHLEKLAEVTLVLNH